jgi:hypothetical protein
MTGGQSGSQEAPHQDPSSPPLQPALPLCHLQWTHQQQEPCLQEQRQMVMQQEGYSTCREDP